MDERLFPQHLQRIQDRSLSEMIGIARGLLADDILNDEEIAFFITWLKGNTHATGWPFDVLRKMFLSVENTTVSEEQRQALKEILQDLIGNKPAMSTAPSLATTLPLTRPATQIVFPDHSFCLTGRFAFGTRKECKAEILKRGGRIQDDVTTRLDYLVIGFIGSEAWMYSSFGRKIQKALEYNESASSCIAIVSEQNWVEALTENS